MDNKSKKTEEKKSIWQTDVKDLFKSDVLKKDISAKGIIMVIAALGTLGAYAYFMVYPQIKEYKSANEKLEVAQSELLKYESKLAEMPVLEKQLLELESEAKLKERELSHDMEDGLFLIGLDKTISNLGLTLKNYSIQDSIDYDNFYAIPMTLSIEGNYVKLKELISYLEEQKNITQVMDYSINVKMTEAKTEANKRVYWTRGDSNYHLDKTCPNMVAGEVLFGTSAQSGARKPDPDCVGDVSNTVDVAVTSTASGDVSANISFIVYSSEKDIIKLDTDKPETWEPGKFNPFQDTLN